MTLIWLLLCCQGAWSQPNVSGPKSIGRLPELKSLSLKQARKKLPKEVRVNVLYVETTEASAGDVVRTTPGEGTELFPGARVSVFVAQKEGTPRISKRKSAPKRVATSEKERPWLLYIFLQGLVVLLALGLYRFGRSRDS